MSESPDVVDIFALNDTISPVGCALIINEILKVLIYQKSQIPFPYTWLKTVVNKKRNNPDADNVKENVNISLGRHFQVVSKAYDTVENIMSSMHNEFQNYKTGIKEILIIFGVTPYCPKEYFRIKVNVSFRDHSKDSNDPNKLYQKILRNIFLSQAWLDATQTSIPCTNTYVFIKKNASDEMGFSREREDSAFVPSAPLTISPQVKYFQVNLHVAFCGTSNCCDNSKIFEEGTPSTNSDHETDVMINNDEMQSTFVWSQSKDLIKGFKDRYMNNMSVCELW